MSGYAHQVWWVALYIVKENEVGRMREAIHHKVFKTRHKLRVSMIQMIKNCFSK